jgi:hypothetical protein
MGRQDERAIASEYGVKIRIRQALHSGENVSDHHDAGTPRWMK